MGHWMHKMAMGRMGFGGGGFGSHFGGWGGPCRAGDQPDEMESEFAKALGVTVEQLRNARETAFTNSINLAVTDGELAPKQAERMRAWHSLRPYLNPKAIAARVLEMTPEQLEAAFGQGQTLWDLAAERHLDLPTAITKLRAAFQAIVQQAVADGVITQEQAAEIKQLRGRGFGPGPMGFLGHGGCGRGHGHGFPGLWGGPWQGGPEAGPDAPDAA